MPDEIKVRKTRSLEKKETKKKKEKVKEKKVVKEKKEQKIIPDTTDPFAILRFVLMSEKAIQVIEAQNKLVFVVDKEASKSDIKKAVETVFSTQVGSIQTMIDQKSRKKAYVKFKKEGEAGEIAIRLGII